MIGPYDAFRPWRDTMDEDGRVIRNDLGSLPYRSLAQAIICRAVMDWQKYGHMTELLSTNVKDMNALSREKARIDGVAISNGFQSPQDELLDFFQSPLLGVYCALAGITTEEVLSVVFPTV